MASMAARWDDLRFVLALDRHGTLTAAAASPGVSQPGGRCQTPPARLALRDVTAAVLAVTLPAP